MTAYGRGGCLFPWKSQPCLCSRGRRLAQVPAHRKGVFWSARLPFVSVCHHSEAAGQSKTSMSMTLTRSSSCAAASTGIRNERTLQNTLMKVACRGNLKLGNAVHSYTYTFLAIRYLTRLTRPFLMPNRTQFVISIIATSATNLTHLPAFLSSASQSRERGPSVFGTSFATAENVCNRVVLS